MIVKRNKDSLERCLNQVFRPKQHFPFLNQAGKGNCTICSYDLDNNYKCSGYSPVVVRTITSVSDDHKTEGDAWTEYSR
jgi:hypothetical protein